LPVLIGAAAVALSVAGVVAAVADESVALEVPVVVELAVSVLELQELRASKQAASAGRVERSIVLLEKEW
jgi:hypothetical protein